MKSYLIHLIRNGTCQGSLEGRYIGRTESPLSETGMHELLAVKRESGYPEVEAYYSCPNIRCVDSLKIIYPYAEPEVIFEMAECDFGEWENKTAKELQSDPKFAAWISEGQTAAPPDGESSAVFMQRVCRGFETLVQNLLAKGTTSAALVATGGVIMTILAAYGLPRAKMTDWICEPGKGYTIRITPGLWMRSMVCEVIDTLPSMKDTEENHDELSFVEFDYDEADDNKEKE